MVVALAAAVGTLIGVLAGWYGGLVDLFVVRVIDVFLAFPGILLAIALAKDEDWTLVEQCVKLCLTCGPTATCSTLATIIRIAGASALLPYRNRHGRTVTRFSSMLALRPSSLPSTW